MTIHSRTGTESNRYLQRQRLSNRLQGGIASPTPGQERPVQDTAPMLWLSALVATSYTGIRIHKSLVEAGSQNQGRGFQDQQGVTNPSVAAPALTPTTTSQASGLQLTPPNTTGILRVRVSGGASSMLPVATYPFGDSTGDHPISTAR